jgi:quercetin dioxygenase-like cupin family protein
MPNRFIKATEAISEPFDGRINRWLCRPGQTEAKDLAVIEAEFAVGQGHDFHTHPEFEECIYVLSGRIEQWVDQERKILDAGDLAHIPMGMVHATFNVGQTPARILAILSPGSCKGPGLVDVSQQEPWKSIRG